MSNNNNQKGFNSGVLLIAIGVVALFFTLADIPVVFSLMWKFWPVLLLIAGFLFLPIKPFIKAILLTVTLIASCIIYTVEVKDYNHVSVYSHYDSDDYSDEDNDEVDMQLFSEPYNNDVEYAEVDIEYGAGEMMMLAPCANLIESRNISDVLHQTFGVRYDDDKVKVNVNMEKNVNLNVNANDNRYMLALNENPVWDMEFEVGVVDMDFDLSDYKVSKLNISGGLSDIDIKIGDKWNETYVEIDAGASDITIRLPKDSGCYLEMDSALTGKNIKGFNKIKQGTYQTDNYSYSNNKVVIDIESGVSNITVLRY